MPLPLAPLVPLAVRLGLVTAVGIAVRRFVAARSYPGRTDQRAEDAFDDLGDGLAVHRPADRAEPGQSQTNSSARVRRVIRIGNRRIELDVALMTRFRIRKS